MPLNTSFVFKNPNDMRKVWFIDGFTSFVCDITMVVVASRANMP